MDPLDSIPDHFKCPVCLDLPKNKVYQCREGHPVCDECFPRLSSCPQCRLRFKPTPIRSLVMEQMLDQLKLECPYKDFCYIKEVDRKMFPKHLELCRQYNAIFGACKTVCKRIGYDYCYYQMSGRNAKQIIYHFEMAHKAVVVDADRYRFEIKIFSKEGTRDCFIFNRVKEGYAFLILADVTGEEKKCLKWDFYYWQYPGLNQAEVVPSSRVPFKVKCSFVGSELEGMTSFSFIPKNLLQAESQNGKMMSSFLTKLENLNRDSKTVSVMIEIKKNNLIV